MNENKHYTIIISHHDSMLRALNLMTRRRASTWFKFDAKRAGQLDKTKLNIELCPKGNHKYVYFLHLGQKILSRDIGADHLLAEDKTVQYGLENGGKLVSLIQSKELDILAASKLRLTVSAPGEACANGIFIGNILQMIRAPFHYYNDTLFLDITAVLKPVEDDGVLEGSSPSSQIINLSETVVDMKDLTLYDELRRIAFDPHLYCDDVNIEYRIEGGKTPTYYFINEWCSNHNWDLDPFNLAIFRVSALVLPETVSREKIRFETPIRFALNRKNKKGYYIEKLRAEYKTNFGVKIFTSIDPKTGEAEENPKNGTKIFDTYLKFKYWLACRDDEIYDA